MNRRGYLQCLEKLRSNGSEQKIHDREDDNMRTPLLRPLDPLSKTEKI